MALEYQALIATLDELLGNRQIADGFNLLRDNESRLFQNNPAEVGTGSILVRVAQWTDLGYRDVDYVKTLIDRIPANLRAQMRLSEFLQLRIAEAFCAMGEENVDRAIGLLSFVLQSEAELADQRLIAIAHFWKGRSHRKKGEYDLAMTHVARGREIMQAIHEPKLAAVIQMQESWLLFQKGQMAEARQVLDEAWH